MIKQLCNAFIICMVFERPQFNIGLGHAGKCVATVNALIATQLQQQLSVDERRLGLISSRDDEVTQKFVP